MLYPEAFAQYLKGIPEELRSSKSLMVAYSGVLSREQHDEERRIAANMWSQWEHSVCSFARGEEVEEDVNDEYSDHENLAFARIECHYFMNKCFFKSDGYLLADEQMKKVAGIRTRIVQGRWDVVCPRISANDLLKKFNKENVDMVLVENAGHSAFEPGIETALLRACDEFGQEYGWMGAQGANFKKGEALG